MFEMWIYRRIELMNFMDSRESKVLNQLKLKKRNNEKKRSKQLKCFDHIKEAQYNNENH